MRVPGLDPGIDPRTSIFLRKGWVAGSSPAMTTEIQVTNRPPVIPGRWQVGLPTCQRARNVDESCARAMGETVGDDQRPLVRARRR
jgi:hypothetical protein